MWNCVQSVCLGSKAAFLMIQSATSKDTAQEFWITSRSLQVWKIVSSFANHHLDADGSPMRQLYQIAFFTKPVPVWMNPAITASLLKEDALITLQQQPKIQQPLTM